MNTIRTIAAFLSLALTATAATAGYPDLSGVGACNFVNPFAGSNDCVQYTGDNWDAASADADCQTLFSTPSFVGTFTAGATCAITDHGADCVEDLGGLNEKVNQNAVSNPALCGTLLAVCNSILVGDYFPVPDGPCDAGGGGGDVDYGTLEQEAIDAIQPNADVDVNPVCDFDNCVQEQIANNQWTTYSPLTANLDQTGVIFFPGGSVDYRAYGPLAQELARNGIQTVILPTPDSSLVNGVLSDPEHASISNWILAGHSLGGVTAIKYIVNNPSNIAGLALLASFPDAADSLSALPLKAVSIYGTNDLLATPGKVLGSVARLPVETLFAKIRGGNHAQFGFYGNQTGDGDADVLDTKQLELTAASVRHLVARVNAGGADNLLPAIKPAQLNLMTHMVGSWSTQRHAGGGYTASQISWFDTDVLRTSATNEFVAAKPSLTTSNPRFHLNQYVAQTGNPTDIRNQPIIDGELQTKFLTQARIENELGLSISSPQGSCADQNESVVAFTKFYLSPEELAKVNTWTVVYEPDQFFATGPDFIADPASRVNVTLTPASLILAIESPSFFATLDPINGAAAGSHYCKTLSYERAFIILREVAAVTP